MKLANAIEGGISGATTLSLLKEALHKIDDGATHPFLHKSGIIKQLKKGKKKHGHNSNKLYVKLATELLASIAPFGLIGLHKKKNVLLRGGLLGAAVGLGAAFLQEDNKDKAAENRDDINGAAVTGATKKDGVDKLITVALYTAGGLVAGAALKRFNKKEGKSKKKHKALKLKKLLKKK